MFGQITETDKLILLYQLETKGSLEPDVITDMTDEEIRFICTSGEYILWESTKRDFDYSELSNSHWLETTYRGEAAKLDCLKTRSAVLSPLMVAQPYYGEWHIHNGILRMSMTSQKHDFELFSMANDSGNIHSLLLFKDQKFKGTANITLMR